MNEIDFFDGILCHVKGYAGDGANDSITKHQILTTENSYTSGIIYANLGSKVDNGYFDMIISTKSDKSNAYTKEETDARIRQIIHEIIGSI